MRPKKALILAAGRGTRLGRLTQQTPKPMVRVHDRPALATHVEMLQAAGVGEIWINLHHAPQPIIDYFGDRVRYSREDELLGTSGALKKLEAEFSRGPFFVVYGDNHIEFDYSSLPARGVVTMLLHHRDVVGQSGVVELGPDQRILSFQEKPAPGTELSHLVNAGVYLCQPEIFQFIPEGDSDFARDVFPRMLAARSDFYGFISPVTVTPLDTPEALATADPLWVAQIGAGKIGARRAGLFPHLATVADIDFERAKEVAAPRSAGAFRNWEEAISDERIRIVSIATTNNLLAPVSRAALEHNKHVLVEKPAALHSTELEPLVKMARERGRVYQTGFNYRFHPAIDRARTLLLDGAIGRLMRGVARHGHGGREGLENEWRSKPELSGGGELLDQGVHLIDLARWFANDNAVAVTGALRTDFWPIQPLEDYAALWIDMSRGAKFALEVSLTQWKNLFYFELVGERGALIVEGLGGSYGPERLTIIRRPPCFGSPDVAAETFAYPDDCWAAQWQEMERAIRCGDEPSGSGADSLACLRIIEGARESSLAQKTVSL